jgi:hypothetical protein
MACHGGESNQLMQTATLTDISLEAFCTDPMCTQFASPLFEQMSSGRYDLCAVLDLPDNIGEWKAMHRTARRRAAHSRNFGYLASVIRRQEFVQDIHAINTSKPVRQGRPMSAGYLSPPSGSKLPDYPCARHGVHTYGVIEGHDYGPELVAYMWIYRAGDLALVSQILGHSSHEPNDVMYLLFEHALEREIAYGPGFVVYNRFDSGGDGLRYFKTRLGFEEREVRWMP